MKKDQLLKMIENRDLQEAGFLISDLDKANDRDEVRIKLVSELDNANYDLEILFYHIMRIEEDAKRHAYAKKWAIDKIEDADFTDLTIAILKKKADKKEIAQLFLSMIYHEISQTNEENSETEIVWRYLSLFKENFEAGQIGTIKAQMLNFIENNIPNKKKLQKLKKIID